MLPATRGPSIGLAMIVKDEAHVIARCLASVLPIVDYACIIDTGSTDGTQEVVRRFFHQAGLPGEVVDEPWRDFAHNRTRVLQRLRERSDIDYAFVIDADDELVLDPAFDPIAFRASLEKDVYTVRYVTGDVQYHLPRLFRNAEGFYFKSVLHEYLERDRPFTRGMASGVRVLVRHEGTRSCHPDKYWRDADLLEKALDEENDPGLIARYTFYLGQSYGACREYRKALDAYLRRASMGFWNQEVFVALYRAAQIKQRLGYPAIDVIDAYKAAADACPARAEALYQVARLCRQHRRDGEGYVLAKRALSLPFPEEGLFVDTAIYRYALLDEFVILAFQTHHYEEAHEAALRLLRESGFPSGQRSRIERNAAIAAEKMTKAWRAGAERRSSGFGTGLSAPHEFAVLA